MEPKIETQTELPSQTQQNGEAPSPPEINNCKKEPEVPGPVAPQQTKPTAASAKAVKKNPKSTKEQKKAKEEEKRLKLLLRAYETVGDPTAKLEALGRKYIQLASDNRTVEMKKDELDKQNEKLSKQSDQLQSELNRVTMAKGKLESLCRELQRHSKLVKEECQLRTQEEETKRKELSDKFQTTINDISEQMQDNFKRNQELKEENAQLAQKLKSLVEQYEVREEHVEKIFKHKQLELQLAEAKMAQQGLMHNEDRENSLLEKQQLVKQALEYQKKCEILTKTEAELRAQVSMYTGKFDEFQKTLNKSNEVFKTFKKEMDKMTKTIKKLEKENNVWKTRWENTNQLLQKMVAERTEKEKEMAAMKLKNEKLENLCRALQKARKELSDRLDVAGISSSASMPTSDAMTASQPGDDTTTVQQQPEVCPPTSDATTASQPEGDTTVQQQPEVCPPISDATMASQPEGDTTVQQQPEVCPPTSDATTASQPEGDTTVQQQPEVCLPTSDATTASQPEGNTTTVQQQPEVCLSQDTTVETSREETESNGGAKTINGVGEKPENDDTEETKADCRGTIEGSQQQSSTEGGREGEDAAVAEQQEQSSPQGEGLEECVSGADQLQVGIQEEESGEGEIGEREGTQSGAVSEATAGHHEEKEKQPVQQSENGSA